MGAGGSSPLTRGKLVVVATLTLGAGLIPAHAGKTKPVRLSFPTRRAHPRSRGENPIPSTARLTYGGSSPLTRGKLVDRRNRRRARRLISAHAGKTTSGALKNLNASAHPRSRGENTGSAGGCLIVTGSSPLTRGKRLAARSGYDPGGLIPAHAGKTRSRICSESAPAAHPRSRGENISRSKLDTSLIGSSPLTRGKHRRRRPDSAARRLIPAHAGKTYQAHTTALQAGAHPRSRGENSPSQLSPRLALGSSPLTRGKRNAGIRSVARSRLIPAHAGKTRVDSPADCAGQAHPRSRGENPTDASRGSLLAGSSPLTRGKRTPGHACHGPGGLIPAHAGKTACARASTSRPSAHPRSRGENYTLGGTASVCSGSSPLTRGKLMSLRIPTDTSAAHPRSRGENACGVLLTTSACGSSPLTRGKHWHISCA